MTNGINVPPGWYPDPHGRKSQRYWDGTAWTVNTAPYGAPPEPVRSPASRVVILPWWQTTSAIVLGLLLCFPIGLVALWKRPGLSTMLRGGVTAGVVVLLVIAVAAPQDEPKKDSAARGIASVSTPPPTTPTIEPTPEAASVPELVGLSRAEARQALSAVGLRIGSVQKEASDASAGTILRQSLEPGTSLAPGGSVTLVVASPLPRVPGVIGLSKSAALAELKEQGFRATVSTKTVTSGDDGTVLSQSPKSGVAARPGTTIKLVIANVEEPAAPPSNCTEGYSPCLAPASDYDCAGGSGDGPKYVNGVVEVTGSDPYDLDRDGDGFGCD